LVRSERSLGYELPISRRTYSRAELVAYVAVALAVNAAREEVVVTLADAAAWVV